MDTTGILIVEDEKIIAKGIEKRLRGMGYAVAGLASTGEEAIQNATELHPDLVLMDIHLGAGMDGVEAADVIRSRLNLPVVYLTAHSDDATLQRAKLTEPFGYLLKPYEDKDLRTAIEISMYKHQMERRLRENEQWLAATLGSIGDGVIATNEEGRVRFMNSVAEQLTGWTQADALGRDVAEVFQIVDEQTRQPIPNPALVAMNTGEAAYLDKRTILLDKSGTEFPIDDSAAPIRDVNGKVAGAVLVFRDITERCRLEEHLRHAQKMEAIGRLAGGIAHDFNNIMTVITGYSDLLLNQPQSSEVTQEFLRQITIAGRRAATLTQQILAFSRKQMLVPCVLSLNTIVRDMGGIVRRLIGEEIEFITDLAADLGSVKTDPAQMGQVILNLAVNARDAMPQGGKLVVSTANAEFNERSANSHDDLKPGRYAMLSVTDTGCGMSEEVLAHVFEPFFTTKDAGKGTGLGLASVYGIVKQSGGHIEVSSKVGVGTTFRVYLPRIEEPRPETPSPDPCQVFKGNETILLVEDEEAVRLLTKTVLEQCGYKVLEAVNGQYAVTASDSYDGPIHLLITDLVMPQLSGRMAAERLAQVQWLQGQIGPFFAVTSYLPTRVFLKPL
jgi:two-component system cell cycle sensor histidine kinase/response regulator CckA